MQYFIGMDDTDTLESTGTGHLARTLAGALAGDFGLTVNGVTRHQLLEDERVPKTAKNSCAALHLESEPDLSIEEIAAFARQWMLGYFQPGSDPGLCVAKQVPDEIVAFGQRAQREFLFQQEPRQLAAQHGLFLEGLGGSQDGVIGALAAVGLAASGSDGRYVLVGSIRDLQGLLPVPAVLAAGVVSVQTLDGETVEQGQVLADKLRPARRNGQPILFVAWDTDHWQPLKLD
jgi:tRNA(Ile2) C34 agmatinyltransferase TiaS